MPGATADNGDILRFSQRLTQVFYLFTLHRPHSPLEHLPMTGSNGIHVDRGLVPLRVKACLAPVRLGGSGFTNPDPNTKINQNSIDTMTMAPGDQYTRLESPAEARQKEVARNWALRAADKPYPGRLCAEGAGP